MGFPSQLRAARIAAGLTQRQIADAIGITNSTYCGYETGKREPDVAKIKKLSKILNVPADNLLDTGISPQKSPLYSSEAMEVARVYDTLDVDGKQRIHEVIKRELEIKLSMDSFIERIRVLRLYDYYLDINNLEESGIDLERVRPAEHPFVVPENPPKDQAEVIKKINDRELTQPIGVHFRRNGQYDKIYIADLGTQAVPGTLGLYNINGRTFLAKIKGGKFFFHPYSRSPSKIPEDLDVECKGAVVGVIDAKFVYR